MVVREQIRVGRHQEIALDLESDGCCHDRQTLALLFRRAAAVAPDNQGLWEAWRSYSEHGRLNTAEILVLADLGSRLGEGRPLDACPYCKQDLHTLPWEARPETLSPTCVEPPQPGLSFVMRRLTGVLFLSPAVLVGPAVRAAKHMWDLTFRPNATLRTSTFNLRRVVSQAAHFAFYEDFRPAHALLAASTLAAYSGLATTVFS